MHAPETVRRDRRAQEAAITLSEKELCRLVDSIRSAKAVDGLTHRYYRYPARFCPAFARTAIELFSKPGDIILDPFMGGGTTLVEAMAAGRNSIGCDLSTLAVFVVRAKTTLLRSEDSKAIADWASTLTERITLRNPPIRESQWVEGAYQRNISGRCTWQIRKTIELLLAELDSLKSERQKVFARCAILRTGQWALDNQRTIPRASEFRGKFQEFLSEMLVSAADLANAVKETGPTIPWALPLHKSAADLEPVQMLACHSAPRLILTSPPYPGVHILYHRWQVQGRRETAAPFWVANCLDGMPSSYYTFGDRQQKGLDSYYENLLRTFTFISRMGNNRTMLIQMVAFSNPVWQLHRYLEVMKAAGLKEVFLPLRGDGDDGRLWRVVPNRKWYAAQKGSTSSCYEVVLFHKMA